MTKKKSSADPPSRDAKRARFEEQSVRSSGPSPIVLVAGVLALLALLGGGVLAMARTADTVGAAPAAGPASSLESYRTGSQGLEVKAATEGHEPYPLVEVQDGAVHLSLSTFDDGLAHNYTFMHEGRPLEFFVLKSDDGVVRAAFNACDVCFQANKGYTQDGDTMACNNCGSRFPADQINVLRGGCNPSSLERTVSGEALIIEFEDLLTGQDLF